ncbi:hypothetical protein BDZ89DRAFT_1016326 [Hymenopellis radicata]|nr:hypothetical protein BDZ89DRAFT_1016326 [Hymenopellis radicata]
MMKTKHAASAQAEQFAQVLGFRDLQEALLVVDLADHEVSYKGTVDLVDGLRKEIESIRGENAEMKDRLDDAEAQEHAQAKTIRALEVEVAELRSRYDEILSKKDRLGERYKTDFTKWKNFKQALFDKEIKLRGLTELTPELIREILTVDGALLFESEDKENDPKPKATKRSLSASPTRRKTSRPLSTPIASTSKHLLDSPRGCIASSPFRNAVSTDVPATTSLTPSDKAYRLPQILAPDSDSETEDDSRASSPIRTPAARRRASSPIRKTPGRVKFDLPQTSPKKNAGAKSKLPFASGPMSGKRLWDSPSHQRTILPPPKSPFDTNIDLPDRPTKKRRVSEELPAREPLRLSTGFSTSPRRTKTRPLAVKNEPVDDFSLASSSASTSKAKPKPKIPEGIDYSKYKGRGRYSNIGATPQHDAHNTTINATFAIDPSRNDGLDYAYEEVVRGKEKRRNLHGGDCECCRDYYEGVGPLPPRQGMPLWKSPEPNKKASPVTTPRRERKKGISRHRHQWAQGGTPPDYWNIGFPDTQEVESINERARDMREKRWDEVGKDGRYVRK